MAYFTTKASFEMKDPKGVFKKFKRNYLTESDSITEAEENTVAFIQEDINGNSIECKSTSETNYDDIIHHEDGNYWWKGMINLSESSDSGKQSTSKLTCLINADNFANAYKAFKNAYEHSLYDCKIISLQPINIEDVIYRKREE